MAFPASLLVLSVWSLFRFIRIAACAQVATTIIIIVTLYGHNVSKCKSFPIGVCGNARVFRTFLGLVVVAGQCPRAFKPLGNIALRVVQTIQSSQLFVGDDFCLGSMKHVNKQRWFRQTLASVKNYRVLSEARFVLCSRLVSNNLPSSFNRSNRSWKRNAYSNRRRFVIMCANV